MDIAGRKIGPSYPPLVIAEIGINHGADLAVATRTPFIAVDSNSWEIDTLIDDIGLPSKWRIKKSGLPHDTIQSFDWG